jgi:hypothetical protein
MVSGMMDALLKMNLACSAAKGSVEPVGVFVLYYDLP